MKGEKKEKLLSVDDVFYYTNKGYDIYKRYLDKVHKNMKCPWRVDKNPSFGVFLYDDIWLWKDQAEGNSGNGISFVMKLFGLDFPEAMNKIKWDFNLGGKPSIYTMIYNTKETYNRSIDNTVHISFTSMPFDQKHARYWNEYHLSEDYLKKFDVYRVKSLNINYQRVPLPEGTLNYAYYHKPTNKAKILRIGGNKWKWKNSVSGDVLWFKENIKECNRLVISKSVKDSLCLSLFGINTVAVQSESISGIEANIDWLSGIDCDKYINFGSDPQGKRESRKITDKFGYRHYNVPDPLLEQGINDSAEFCKYDIRALEKHLKEKGII